MTVPPYQATLVSILDAIRITQPARVTWYGEPAFELPPSLCRSVSATTRRSVLAHLIQRHLYEYAYCPGTPIRRTTAPATIPETARTAFVTRLSAANSGRGHWQPGWTVARTRQGVVEIRGAGLALTCRRDQVLPKVAAAITAGDDVSIRQPKELTCLAPGFYVALGDRDVDPDQESSVVRWYWNVTPDGAVALVRALTERLNDAALPFRLKVLSDPTSYRRCDAGVLYVGHSQRRAVATIVGDALPELSHQIKDGTPAFTKRMAPGVGLAEDPGGGDSFGMNRCMVVAEALLHAHDRGEHSVQERLETISRCLDERGLSMSRPYLNPGSRDMYQAIAATVAQAPARAAKPKPGPTRSQELDIAAAIGRRLCAGALWHRDRCTWISAMPAANGAVGEVVHRPVGFDLYGGTAGVAWFLGELGAATSDRAFIRTAKAAIMQALWTVESAQELPRGGLYDGLLGVVLVASRLGLILDEPQLRSRAQALLEEAIRALPVDSCDVLGGAAGGILALLALRPLVDEPGLDDAALGLGEHLLRTARHSPEGSSWPWDGQLCLRDPTGYSHGTAGPTHALLELFSLSTDLRFMECATRAAAYDRNNFDATAGNWLDLRLPPNVRQRRRWVRSCATAWCHGAPGIAIARLRASQILDDPRSRDEALIALRATRLGIETALGASAPHFCLCHGLAGNVEVVAHVARALELNDESDAAAIERVVAHGALRYGHSGAGLTNKTDEPPGLLAGLAGIGNFYLRRAHPELPSPLLVGAARLDLRPGRRRDHIDVPRRNQHVVGKSA